MADSPYDFWLLDLDGTVVDTEPSYIQEVFGEVGRRLNVSFSAPEREALWYGFAGEREQVLMNAGVDADRFWSVFHEVEDPERRATATHLYSDAASFVPQLDRPTGIVTHCQPHLTEPVLDSLGITDWFDTVVCCSDETGWKPDPGPVELAMADLGVDGTTHEGVFVGDDPNDVGAARNANLTAVHVNRREPTDWSARASGSSVVTNAHEQVETFGHLRHRTDAPTYRHEQPRSPTLLRGQVANPGARGDSFTHVDD